MVMEWTFLLKCYIIETFCYIDEKTFYVFRHHEQRKSLPLYQRKERHIMKHVILLIFAFCLMGTWAPVQAQHVNLQTQGTARQLRVDGQPFVILGGELGNSSATNREDVDRIFAKLERMGLNTVLVPAYWELLEPVEGQFDFTLTDQVMQTARQHHLKLVMLWFGAWKNSMSCYAPAWVKADTQRFPRAETRTGKPLEILSAFSPAVQQADEKAFTAWIRHVAEEDRRDPNVLMIQIENEIGMLEEARDRADAAEKVYRSAVPDELLTYIYKNKATLQPALRSLWEGQGSRTQGSWAEVFGTSLQADEVFMAWQYATYVERLTQVARREFNVPLYVNAAMNSRGRQPGEYPSAGPLAHLMDIWHCAAPTVDVLAPDLYDKGFTDWVAQYHQAGNPLFIPEIRLCDDDGVRAFYALAEHDALGFSPFSIEDADERPFSPLVAGYRCLRELMPILLRQQGLGTMRGVLFSQEEKQTVIDEGDAVLNVRHFFTLPWDARATDGSPWPEGGGLILKLKADEYLIAGKGLVVEFLHPEEYALKPQTQEEEAQRGEDGFLLKGEKKSKDKASATAQTATQKRWKAHRLGLASVDEVSIGPDGSIRPVRRLNGDQTHQGRHVRIGVDEFSILHVKLYTY
jgi:hypothetical protein